MDSCGFENQDVVSFFWTPGYAPTGVGSHNGRSTTEKERISIDPVVDGSQETMISSS